MTPFCCNRCEFCFRHDRGLFADVSRLIYRVLHVFYAEATGRPLLTGMGKSPAGLRRHAVVEHALPHHRAWVGFDEEGTFFYIPFSGLRSVVEVFRRRVIKLLVGRKLLNEVFARNLLSWKHSGFSIDNSVRILDESAQESLAEYAELTQHIPPKRLQLIRRYGWYASRTKGRWEEIPWIAERAPERWKAAHQRDGVADDLGYEPLSDGDKEVTVDAGCPRLGPAAYREGLRG